jgi:hypothetical protein
VNKETLLIIEMTQMAVNGRINLSFGGTGQCLIACVIKNAKLTNHKFENLAATNTDSLEKLLAHADCLQI